MSFNRSGICLQTCRYDVIKFVAKSMGMKEIDDTDTWDVCWTDSLISVEKAKDMKKYQVSLSSHLKYDIITKFPSKKYMLYYIITKICL